MCGKYLKILLKMPIYVKIAVLVILSLAVMELMNGGISRPRRSWKSGGTTVTFSRDGTLRVWPSWGVAISYDLDGFYAYYCSIYGRYGFYGLKRITKVRWKGAMKDYTVIAPPWRCVDISITNLVFEEGVTYIGKGTFAHEFSNIRSITIPNSVTEIGSMAFWDCLNLTSMTIGNSVTKIGMFALPGPHGSNSYFFTLTGGLHYIISLNPIPPEMDFQLVCEKTVLYVPDGSVDTYRAADGWDRFIHIKPLDGEAAIDEPSPERLNCSCWGIGWCGGKDGGYCNKARLEELNELNKSSWLVHLTLILVIYGFTSWMYVLFGFIMKKNPRKEIRKRKILLTLFTPIFTVVLLFCWGPVWGVIETEQRLGYEITHLPYYDHRGAIIYGGIYLATASLFYQVFRKKIKRQATIVILTTLHIVIFASLMIGGGL